MKYSQIVKHYQEAIQLEGRQFHIHKRKIQAKEGSDDQNVCKVCEKNNKRDHVSF